MTSKASITTKSGLTTQSKKSIVLSSPLYYRKSYWNGRKTEPVVLVMQNEMLSMYDKQGIVVFSVSLDKLHVRFGGLMNQYMYIQFNELTYALTGLGTMLSPDFSDVQKKIIRDPNHATDFMIAGTAAAGVGAIAEAFKYSDVSVGFYAGAGIAEVVAGHESDKVMKRWRKSFNSAGVAVDGGQSHMFQTVFFAFVILMIVSVMFLYLVH